MKDKIEIIEKHIKSLEEYQELHGEDKINSKIDGGQK